MSQVQRATSTPTHRGHQLPGTMTTRECGTATVTSLRYSTVWYCMIQPRAVWYGMVRSSKAKPVGFRMKWGRLGQDMRDGLKLCSALLCHHMSWGPHGMGCQCCRTAPNTAPGMTPVTYAITPSQSCKIVTGQFSGMDMAWGFPAPSTPNVMCSCSQLTITVCSFGHLILYVGLMNTLLSAMPVVTCRLGLTRLNVYGELLSAFGVTEQWSQAQLLLPTVLHADRNCTTLCATLSHLYSMICMPLFCTVLYHTSLRLML
jgi:hypothetical protein